MNLIEHSYDYYSEVIKLMYPDGYHMGERHGLWKLKEKLTQFEWGYVKPYFQYFKKTDEEVKNMKYYGWATTNPVKVMLLLKDLRELY